jgi:hypothetical protein
MQKLKLKSIYMLCKNCRPSHTDHNKIGFAIFDFFVILYGFYKVRLKHTKGEESFC